MLPTKQRRKHDTGAVLKDYSLTTDHRISGMVNSIAANIETFDHYYDKPAWWFRWRYDTQVKRKTCLALIKNLKREWSKKRIFELGFGSGEVLCSFPTSCELYGAEISPTAVDKIGRRVSE